MLVGRSNERLRIESLLDSVRRGNSRALVLLGEPGIGKTALLEQTAANAKGLRVIRACAVGAETAVPFAGLSDLLRPLLDRLDQIPTPQAEALRSAFALAATATTDPLAIGAGTLSLLAAAAEDQPLLAIVDDCHVLDLESADALSFAVRRLGAEGVGVLLAARDGEAPSPLLDAKIPEIKVIGLDLSAAGELLRQSVGQTVGGDVTARLHAAAGGNPLALIEMQRLLSQAQLSGTEALPDPLPPGSAIQRAFLRRLEPLAGDTRMALLLLAISDTGDAGEVAQAAKRLGLDGAAVDAARASQLVAIGDGVLEWTHPLARAVVYHSASPAHLRESHTAYAAILVRPADRDRQTWHLAATATGPEESLASALVLSGGSAMGRGAYGRAARAYRRAAELSPPGEERSKRLLLAAGADLMAGSPETAGESLDRALIDADDPMLRASIQHNRGRIQMLQGAPAAARRLLETEGSRIEAAVPQLAAHMFAEASVASSMTGNVREALVLAERAEQTARHGNVDVPAPVLAGLASSLILAGRGSEGAAPLSLARRLLDGDAWLDAILGAWVGNLATFLEDYVSAREVLERVIETSRSRSAIAPLPYALSCLADLDFRTGRWVAAYAGASEAVRLARDTRQANLLGRTLVSLALVEGGRGLLPDGRQHATEAIALADQVGADSLIAFASAALGLLELGANRPEDAIVHFDRAAQISWIGGMREETVVPFHAELVEINVRLDRPAAALAALDSFEDLAAPSARTGTRAALARSRGMVAKDTKFEEHFAEAIDWHRRVNQPFELARTKLALGQRRRRARRRVEAREPLGQALAVFERLGAAGWTQSARSELRASGGDAPAAGGTGLESLTAQEMQVVIRVASGASNREVAGLLFLSPKTVDFHLQSVYSKLSLRSRTQLANLVARQIVSLETNEPAPDGAPSVG